MFSPFGAATKTSSPAPNPFAPKPKASEGNPFGSDVAGNSAGAKRNKRTGRFSDISDNEAKRKGPRTLNDKEKDVSDGGKSRSKRREGRKKKDGDRKKTMLNGDVKSKKPRQQRAPLGKEISADNAGDVSRPTSSSSASSANFESSTQPNFSPPSADPHARKVYTQLRKDGISPPDWPSQPGDPNSKAAMAKFKDRYKNYRDQVRDSLTKSGLMDDPNKRRALKDAIEFKGISEDMCPEFEKIERITEFDVVQPEKDPKTAIPATPRMVKKLARSAAGQEAPLPMDVRSVPTLRRTLDYLIDDLLKHDGNLPGLHGFLWDRTRAIRRDFTFFSSLTPDEHKTQVYVLENIARFHVTALHLLSRKGNTPEGFVEQQELEQLGRTLLSLRDLYDDCNAQDIVCENEAEFRAYYLIFHAQDPNIMETLQRSWRPHLWRDSDEVRTAVSLVEALQNTKDFHGPHGPLKEGPSLAASGAHHSFFRIVEDPAVSYTMACFAECHFPTLRRSILRSVARALARPKEETKDVTAATLNRFLRFDTIDEAIEFAELHELEFEPDEDASDEPGRQRLLLRHRQQLPHQRLTHQFSQTFVEEKRGSRKLPDVLHQTVFQDPNAQGTQGETDKDSLFVPDAQPTLPAPASTTEQQKATGSPFSAFGKPSGGFSSPLSNGVAATPNSQPKANPFGPPSNQAPPATNPFGAPSKPGPSQGLGGFSAFGQAKDTNKTSPANENGTTKPSPFSGLFTQKTNGETSAVAGEPAKGSDTTTTTGTASLDKPKMPTFDFSAAKSQPTPSTTQSAISTSAASLLPTAAPAKPTQASPSLTSFEPAAEHNKLATPTTTKETTEKPELGNGLSPSPFLKDTTKTTGPGTDPAFNFGGGAPSSTATALQKSSTSLARAQTGAPARDFMADFTRWFVKGDNGLMDDFEVYMVDEILREVFRKWVEEEEEKRRREEEERTNAEVEAFRVYNLRVKFFYRWKNNARIKRLRFLRQSGREQVRAYHASKREEEKEAARMAAEERPRVSEVDRSKEMTEMLKRKRLRRSQAEEELLASKVLSGVDNEREHAARIVRHTHNTPDARLATSSSSRPSSSGSTTKKVGGKTQAIREKLLLKNTEGFRRSMPSTASTRTASPDPSKRFSNVSERWRLKAMGIVQMPDGTALPENMANEVLYGNKKYPGLGSRPRASSYSTSELRAPPTSAARTETKSLLSRSHGTGSSPPTNKRKRPAEEDSAEAEGEVNPHKRVMSENEKLIQELRAMREELEEGAAWYRSQTEKLQSEAGSRGTTPWNDSI